MNKITTCFAVGSAVVLTGCATPQEQCVANATQQYRSVQAALSTAQSNINRGYAVHTQTVPYTVQSTCYRNDPYTYMSIPYPCPSTSYRTQSTPVPIDAAEERRKIAQYQQALPRLQSEAKARVQQCNAQYPESSTHEEFVPKPFDRAWSNGETLRCFKPKSGSVVSFGRDGAKSCGEGAYRISETDYQRLR